MSLKIESLHKQFAGVAALDNIELQVGATEFVCLLGPSGCGKTTLLRIIAGLLSADSGRILLGEQDLAQRPARERGFGIVFQSYSLFPHMTVAQNVRLRSGDSAHRQRGGAAPRHPVAANRQAGRFRAAFPGAAIRRAATARGHRAGVGRQPGLAVAR